MPDITTTAGAAAGAAAVAVPVALVGAQLDALGWGLFAAFACVAWFEELNDLWRAAASVVFGGGAAAVFSPVGAAIAWSMLPPHLRDLISPEAIRIPLAFGLGAVVPAVYPVLRRRMKRTAAGKESAQ